MDIDKYTGMRYHKSRKMEEGGSVSGYRHCITEGSADRQRQFETELLAMMGQKDFSQISVQDLCQRVGLSRKSFYRYFSSKEDCLNALVDHTILDLTDISFHGKNMQWMLEQYFSYWSQHRDLLDALYHNGMSSLLMERGMLCAAQEFGIRGDPKDRGSSYIQTIFFVSGLISVLLDWHLSGCQMTPLQLAATLADSLPRNLHGVF